MLLAAAISCGSIFESDNAQPVVAIEEASYLSELVLVLNDERDTTASFILSDVGNAEWIAKGLSVDSHNEARSVTDALLANASDEDRHEVVEQIETRLTTVRQSVDALPEIYDTSQSIDYVHSIRIDYSEIIDIVVEILTQDILKYTGTKQYSKSLQVGADILQHSVNYINKTSSAMYLIASRDMRYLEDNTDKCRNGIRTCITDVKREMLTNIDEIDAIVEGSVYRDLWRNTKGALYVDEATNILDTFTDSEVEKGSPEESNILKTLARSRSSQWQTFIDEIIAIMLSSV